jgi:protein-tyrosine phosphatase
LVQDLRELPRRVPLRGAVNFRDVGGYLTRDGRRVRYGRIYRSDSLCHLDDEDHELLLSLGLRVICDFRVHGERRLRPDRLPPQHSISLQDLSMLPRGSKEMWQALNDCSITHAGMIEEMRQHYRLFVLEHSERFRQMFDLLLDDANLPILLHCASGKDRTGFAVSLVLAALGVDWEAILHDYMVSDRYRRDVAQLNAEAARSDAVTALQQADARYLAAGYSAIIDRWGGIDAYFAQELGLDEVRRAALQDRLLERAA